MVTEEDKDWAKNWIRMKEMKKPMSEVDKMREELRRKIAECGAIEKALAENEAQLVENRRELQAIDAELRAKNNDLDEMRSKLRTKVLRDSHDGEPIDFESLGRQILGALGIDFDKIDAIAQHVDQTVDLIKDILPKEPEPAETSQKLDATLRVRTADGSIHEIPGHVLCEAEHDAPECDCEECQDEAAKWTTCDKCGAAGFYSGFYVEKLESDVDTLMDTVKVYGESLNDVAHRLKHWSRMRFKDEQIQKTVTKFVSHITEVLPE
jgi:hypothetical protein